MASKKRTYKQAPQQTQFEGDGFPEKPPADVTRKMNGWLAMKRAAAEARSDQQDAHEKLVASMRKHEIERLLIPGEGKYIEVNIKRSAKVKTTPKKKRADAGNDK